MGWEQRDAITTGTCAGGDGTKVGDTSLRATLDQVLSGAVHASCRKPHLSLLLPPELRHSGSPSQAVAHMSYNTFVCITLGDLSTSGGN